MNKNEMKNRISIVLKDPILQQGFEIICKENAELKKENAELKEEMNAKQVVLNDFKSRVETVTGRFNKKSSQLTKAKEIIRGLLELGSIGDGDYTYVGEAEQFLNSLK